jgi:FtsH-binding integral membrane protein
MRAQGPDLRYHAARQGEIMYPNNSMTDRTLGRTGERDVTAAAFMHKVYLLMAIGLGATGLAALLVARSDEAIRFFILNRPVFYGLIILELVMVFGFSMLVNRISATAAGALFFTYAAVNGLTMAVIFLVYTASSIASAFFITGGTFAVMSVIGYTTKRDLTGVGHFCLMGLIGLIIASIVNIFLKSPTVYWVTSCLGVLIFVGLTAYDTQKIKHMASINDRETRSKAAISGALTLYLDFINLFLLLLRFLGNRR